MCDDAISNLNWFLADCFLSAPPMMAFLQGYADALMNTLAYRDDETGRTILGLMLENIGQQMPPP